MTYVSEVFAISYEKAMTQYPDGMRALSILWKSNKIPVAFKTCNFEIHYNVTTWNEEKYRVCTATKLLIAKSPNDDLPFGGVLVERHDNPDEEYEEIDVVPHSPNDVKIKSQ